MNHSRIAAMALCLTVGMVGLAAAQTTPSTPSPATPSPTMGGTAPALGTQTPMQHPSAGATNSTTGRAASAEPSTTDIEAAQQQLKAQGLYKGAIDGELGPETKTALAHFQRRSGLPETATLDQQTRNLLMGHATTGSGSTNAPVPTNDSAGSGSTTTPAPTKRY